MGSKKHTLQVFKRFHTIYGQTWTNRYEGAGTLTQMCEEWTRDLAKYSEGEINEAVETCKKHHPLAPTLPQFLELCKMAHSRKFTAQRNESPRSSIETMHAAVANMRKIAAKNTHQVRATKVTPSYEKPDQIDNDHFAERNQTTDTARTSEGSE